jgi:hypothetical protein
MCKQVALLRANLIYLLAGLLVIHLLCLPVFGLNHQSYVLMTNTDSSEGK